MNNLQERVQKMLDGETKRREVALEWLRELSDILAPVSADIWGKNDFGHPCLDNAIRLTIKGNDGEIHFSDMLFRYGTYTMENGTVRNEFGFQRWDFSAVEFIVDNIDTLKGKDFWLGIHAIMGWLPIAIKAMDAEENSRNALIVKLNTEIS